MRWVRKDFLVLSLLKKIYKKATLLFIPESFYMYRYGDNCANNLDNNLDVTLCIIFVSSLTKSCISFTNHSASLVALCWDFFLSIVTVTIKCLCWTNSIEKIIIHYFHIYLRMTQMCPFYKVPYPSIMKSTLQEDL